VTGDTGRIWLSWFKIPGALYYAKAPKPIQIIFAHVFDCIAPFADGQYFMLYLGNIFTVALSYKDLPCSINRQGTLIESENVHLTKIDYTCCFVAFDRM
jgi:hypothetical protein